MINASAKGNPGAVGAAAGARETVSSDTVKHKASLAPTQAPPVERYTGLPFTEDAVALDFVTRYGRFIRYVSAVTTRHKWFYRFGWVITVPENDNREWLVDDTLFILDSIREFCREEAKACGDPHLARNMVSADFIFGVERLARSDRRLAATKEDVGLPKKKVTRKRKAVQP